MVVVFEFSMMFSSVISPNYEIESLHFSQRVVQLQTVHFVFSVLGPCGSWAGSVFFLARRIGSVFSPMTDWYVMR